MDTPTQKTAIEVSDSQQARADSILTSEQRKQIYRQRIVEAQRGKGIRLQEFARAKRVELRGRDTEARRKRAEGIDLAYRALNSDMYGMYDENGQYVDLRQPEDFAYCIPLVIGHFEQAFVQMLKVHPDFDFEPDDPNDNLTARVANVMKDLAIKDWKRLMKPLRHQEVHNLLSAGESWRYLFQAPNPKSPRKVKRPAYNGPELTGATEHVLNENRIHIPHPLSMQRDMSASTPEESTFLIERTLVERTRAEYEYECIIDRGNAGITPEMQLLYNLQRSSTQLDGSGVASVGAIHGPGRPLFGADPGTSNIALLAEQERHFWDVSEYGWFYCDVDETLPDGTVLPAGTILGERFPRGTRVMFCDETVLMFEECEWRKRWTLLRYGIIAGTNAGAGIVKKLLPLNYCINDDFNLGQSVKFTVGHPLTAIDGKSVHELPGAGQLMKISKANVDDINKLVAQWPGQSMPDDGTQERVGRDMQFIGGTQTIGQVGGAADQQAAQHTATGVTAMEQQGADRQLQPVEQSLLADEETLWQIGEAIQRDWTKEKNPELYERLVKRYAEDVANAFFACNLREELNCTVAPASTMPRSMARTTANHMALGSILQSVISSAGENGIDPQVMEFLQSTADSMGIPLAIGEGRTDRREAEFRLNKLADIEVAALKDAPQLSANQPALAKVMYQALAEFCAPLIEPSPDPIEDAPRAFMQDHKTMSDVYKDALFGDQGRSWSLARKSVVRKLWVAHLAAQSMMQEETTRFQAELQKIMTPEEPPQPGVDPQQEAALAAAQADAERQAAEVQAEAEHQREREAADEDHAREQESEDLKLDRDMIREDQKGRISAQLAAAKPQPKNGATA